jgi:hypothetical protein
VTGDYRDPDGATGGFDPQLVRKIARTALCGAIRNHRDAAVNYAIIAHGVPMPVIDGTFMAYRNAVAEQYDVLASSMRWPPERPPEGAVERLRAVVRSVDENGWRDTGYPNESDIDEALDDRDVLVARVAELEVERDQARARLRQAESELERLSDPQLTEQRADRIRAARADYEYRQVGNFRACADCYSPITCAEADESRCP